MSEHLRCVEMCAVVSGVLPGEGLVLHPPELKLDEPFKKPPQTLAPWALTSGQGREAPGLEAGVPGSEALLLETKLPLAGSVISAAHRPSSVPQFPPP